MDARPVRNFTRVAIAIVVAAIVISAAALSYSSFESTVTKTSTTTAMTTVVVDAPPLQLRVGLNATSIQTGGGILAEISLFNPLGANATVSPNYQVDYPILAWNAYEFDCGANPTWSLAGYALFQAHYTSGNISFAGTPLDLRAPLIIECPAFPNPTTIVFSPDSSRTVSYFAQPNDLNESATAGVSAMNATTGVCSLVSNSCGGTSLYGYWTGPPGGYFNPENATNSSPYFHYFPPGKYTLFVEDAWGQTYFAYFQVVS